MSGRSKLAVEGGDALNLGSELEEGPVVLVEQGAPRLRRLRGKCGQAGSALHTHVGGHGVKDHRPLEFNPPDLLENRLDLRTSSNEPGGPAGHEEELLHIELEEEAFEHITLAPQDAGQPGKVHARPPLSRSRNPGPPNSPLGLSATRTRT